MITVENIRRNNIRITPEPIIYYWWFKTNCFGVLFELLDAEIDYERIRTKEINKETYGLLYVGEGKNGHDRLIEWHILDSQNLHKTGVKNGFLSSLRQTLCGLLKLPMSSSKQMINDFMDQNCFIEFETCNLKALLEDKLETVIIKKNYLPLNWKNTSGILTKEHRRILTDCKNRMKK